MYTVASPDPSPRDGGQLPNPNKCNSTLTSGTRGEIPNPDEWNKWERSPPHLYMYTFCRIKRCGSAGCPPPPPIIFERLKLPQQIIYHRKGNLSESPNH